MKRPQRRLIPSAALTFFAPSLFANPTDGVVVGGVADINAAGNGLIISQHTPSAAINWQTFSIGADEFVQFVQPSSSAVALNRVIGGSPSEILGRLNSNGQVFIVNPLGVLFGAGAQVDVGGILASTLDINPNDFMAGDFRFAGSSAAGILNAGNIRAADGGYVVFLGDNVANRGVITANLGTVLLASGSQATLDLQGDGLVNYTLDAAAISDRAGVENLGTLTADGGHVVMDADVLRDVKLAVINNAGLVQARRMTQDGDGSILLIGKGGDIVNSGTLDASSTAADVNGGRIIVTSDGDISMPGTSVMRADGGSNARGGMVRVIGKGMVNFDEGALISATGGQRGGFVELSGHEKLTIRGDVNVGNGGTLLIDPEDVTIAAGAGSNVPGTDVTLYADFVQDQLQMYANVIIVADQSITIQDLNANGDDGQIYGLNMSGTGGSLTLGIGTVSVSPIPDSYGAAYSYSGDPFDVFLRGDGYSGFGILFENFSNAIRTYGSINVVGGEEYGYINVGILETYGDDAHVDLQSHGYINVNSVTTHGANSDIVLDSEYSDIATAAALAATRDVWIAGNRLGDVTYAGDVSVGGNISAGRTIEIKANYGHADLSDLTTTTDVGGYISVLTTGSMDSYISAGNIDSAGSVSLNAGQYIEAGDITADSYVFTLASDDDATGYGFTASSIDAGSYVDIEAKRGAIDIAYINAYAYVSLDAGEQGTNISVDGITLAYSASGFNYGVSIFADDNVDVGYVIVGSAASRYKSDGTYAAASLIAQDFDLTFGDGGVRVHDYNEVGHEQDLLRLAAGRDIKNADNLNAGGIEVSYGSGMSTQYGDIRIEAGQPDGGSIYAGDITGRLVDLRTGLADATPTTGDVFLYGAGGGDINAATINLQNVRDFRADDVLIRAGGFAPTVGSLELTGDLTVAAGYSINLTATSGDISFDDATAGIFAGFDAETGSVTNTGVVTASNQLIVTAATGIDLDSNVSEVRFTNTGSGDVIIVEADGLTVYGSNAAAGGAITITSGGATTVSSALTSTNGAISITSGGSDASTLNLVIGASGSINSGSGNIILRSIDNIEIGGAGITTAGDVTLEANYAGTDAIGQINSVSAGGRVIADHLSLIAASGIGVGTADVLTDVDTLSFSTTSGAVGILEFDGLTVYGSDGSSNVDIVSQGGNLIVGSTGITGNGGAVTLDAENGDVIVGGAISSSGAITAQAGDTDTGSDATVTVNAALTSSTGLITIESADNVVLNAPVMTASGNLVIRANRSMLETTADSYGGISGTGLVTGNDLTLAAATGIALNTDINSVSVSAGSGGNINLVETNGLTIDSTGMSTSSGDISVRVIAGDLTQAGTISPTGGDVSFDAESGNIIGSTFTINGDLITLYAGAADGYIGSTTAAIKTAGNTISFTAHGAGGVYINEGNAGTFYGSTGSGDIALSTALTGALTIGGDILTMGNTTLTTNAADILRTAGTVYGSLVTLTTGAGADNDIGALGGEILTRATTLALNTNSTTGSAYVSEFDGVDLAASTIGDDLFLTAGGHITDSGVLIVTDDAQFTAGSNDITLNAANNFASEVRIVSANNVTLNDSNSLLLGTSTIAGNLTVTTAGSIQDSGALVVTGATSLSAGLGNSISLNNGGNNFSTVTVTGSGSVTLVDGNALTISGITGGNGAVSVTVNAGNLAFGSISSSGNNITLNAVAGNLIRNSGQLTATTGLVTLIAGGTNGAIGSSESIIQTTAGTVSFNAQGSGGVYIKETSVGSGNTVFYGSTDSGVIALSTNSRDITVGSGSGSAYISTSGAVSLTAGGTGSILDGHSGVADIYGGSIAFYAGGAVGSGDLNPLDIATNSLYASSLGGDIDLTNAPTATVIITGMSSSGAGAIRYSQGGQALNINGLISSGMGGVIIDPPTDVFINARINGGGGNVLVEATNDITFNNGGYIDNAANVTIRADQDGDNVGAIIDAQSTDLTDITAAGGGLVQLYAGTSIGGPDAGRLDVIAPQLVAVSSAGADVYLSLGAVTTTINSIRAAGATVDLLATGANRDINITGDVIGSDIIVSTNGGANGDLALFGSARLADYSGGAYVNAASLTLAATGTSGYAAFNSAELYGDAVDIDGFHVSIEGGTAVYGAAIDVFASNTVVIHSSRLQHTTSLSIEADTDDLTGNNNVFGNSAAPTGTVNLTSGADLSLTATGIYAGNVNATAMGSLSLGNLSAFNGVTYGDINVTAGYGAGGVSASGGDVTLGDIEGNNITVTAYAGAPEPGNINVGDVYAAGNLSLNAGGALTTGAQSTGGNLVISAAAISFGADVTANQIDLSITGDSSNFSFTNLTATAGYVAVNTVDGFISGNSITAAQGITLVAGDDDADGLSGITVASATANGAGDISLAFHGDSNVGILSADGNTIAIDGNGYSVTYPSGGQITAATLALTDVHDFRAEHIALSGASNTLTVGNNFRLDGGLTSPGNVTVAVGNRADFDTTGYVDVDGYASVTSTAGPITFFSTGRNVYGGLGVTLTANASEINLFGDVRSDAGYISLAADSEVEIDGDAYASGNITLTATAGSVLVESVTSDNGAVTITSHTQAILGDTVTGNSVSIQVNGPGQAISFFGDIVADVGTVSLTTADGFISGNGLGTDIAGHGGVTILAQGTSGSLSFLDTVSSASGSVNITAHASGSSGISVDGGITAFGNIDLTAADGNIAFGTNGFTASTGYVAAIADNFGFQSGDIYAGTNVSLHATGATSGFQFGGNIEAESGSVAISADDGEVTGFDDTKTISGKTGVTLTGTSSSVAAINLSATVTSSNGDVSFYGNGSAGHIYVTDVNAANGAVKIFTDDNVILGGALNAQSLVAGNPMMASQHIANFTAQGITLTGTGPLGIDVTNQLNLFGAVSNAGAVVLTSKGAMTATGVTGSSVSLVTTGSLMVNGITLNGNVTATGGTVSIVTSEGGVTGTGSVISGDGVHIETHSSEAGSIFGAINVGDINAGSGNLVLDIQGFLQAGDLSAGGYVHASTDYGVFVGSVSGHDTASVSNAVEIHGDSVEVDGDLTGFGGIVVSAVTGSINIFGNVADFGSANGNDGVLLSTPGSVFVNSAGDLNFGSGAGPNEVFAQSIEFRSDTGNVSVDATRLRGFSGAAADSVNFSGTKNVSLGSGLDVQTGFLSLQAGAGYGLALGGTLDISNGLFASAGNIDIASSTLSVADFISLDASSGGLSVSNSSLTSNDISLTAASDVTVTDSSLSASATLFLEAGGQISATGSNVLSAPSFFAHADSDDMTLEGILSGSNFDFYAGGTVHLSVNLDGYGNSRLSGDTLTISGAALNIEHPTLSAGLLADFSDSISLTARSGLLDLTHAQLTARGLNLDGFSGVTVGDSLLEATNGGFGVSLVAINGAVNLIDSSVLTEGAIELLGFDINIANSVLAGPGAPGSDFAGFLALDATGDINLGTSTVRAGSVFVNADGALNSDSNLSFDTMTVDTASVTLAGNINGSTLQVLARAGNFSLDSGYAFTSSQTSITASEDITINGTLDTLGSMSLLSFDGDITNAESILADGDVSLTAEKGSVRSSGLLLSFYGNVSAAAETGIELGGTVSAINQVSLQAGAIDLGAATIQADSLVAEADNITGDGFNLDLNTASALTANSGSITLSNGAIAGVVAGLNAGSDIEINTTAFNVGTLNLEAGGDILSDSTLSADNGVLLEAAGSIAVADIESSVGNISLRSGLDTSVSNITLDDSANLEVIAGQDLILNGDVIGGPDRVLLRAGRELDLLGADITFGSLGEFDAETGTIDFEYGSMFSADGEARFTAGDDINLIDSDIDVGAFVTDAGGDVFMDPMTLSSDRTITIRAGGTFTASQVTFRAASLQLSAGGAITFDSSPITAGTIGIAAPQGSNISFSNSPTNNPINTSGGVLILQGVVQTPTPTTPVVTPSAPPSTPTLLQQLDAPVLNTVETTVKDVNNVLDQSSNLGPTDDTLKTAFNNTADPAPVSESSDEKKEEDKDKKSEKKTASTETKTEEKFEGQTESKTSDAIGKECKA